MPTGYTQQSWATKPLAQVEAICDMQVQANPLVGYESCMEANGWKGYY